MNTEEAQTVKAFAQEAKDFCDLVENYKNKKRGSFLRCGAQSISKMIYLVFRFPALEELETNEETTKPAHIKIDYMKLLSTYFGDWDYYKEVFDAYNPEDKVVVGSLADDFADIYRDLQEGLFFYKRGKLEDVNEAIFQWGLLFGAHWGEHATSALRAIYCRLEEIEVESRDPKFGF